MENNNNIKADQLPKQESSDFKKEIAARILADYYYFAGCLFPECLKVDYANEIIKSNYSYPTGEYDNEEDYAGLKIDVEDWVEVNFEQLHIPDNNVVNPNQSMVEVKTVEQARRDFVNQFITSEGNRTLSRISDAFNAGYRLGSSENEKLKAEAQELREALSESITEIIKLKIHYKDSGHGKKFIKKVESLLAKHA